jgi:hypothetical protein
MQGLAERCALHAYQVQSVGIRNKVHCALTQIAPLLYGNPFSVTPSHGPSERGADRRWERAWVVLVEREVMRIPGKNPPSGQVRHMGPRVWGRREKHARGFLSWDC